MPHAPAPLEAPRNDLGLTAFLAIMLLALLVRTCWVPLGDHEFRLHEAEYLDIFLHRWDGRWSTRVVPLAGLIYRGLGHLSGDPILLRMASLLASLASLAAAWTLLRRQAGTTAAILATLFLSLYGNHAFWSGSPYHVMLPLALSWWALALLTWRRPWADLASAVLFGLAVGARLEVAVGVVAAALLFHTRTREGERGVAHSRGRAVVSGFLAWLGVTSLAALPWLAPLTRAGAHPEGLLAAAPLALTVNVGVPHFLAPWSSPLFILIASLPLVVKEGGRRGFHGVAAPLAALAVAAFLASLAFSDAGYRHSLNTGVALACLAGLGLARLLRHEKRLLKLAGVMGCLLVVVGQLRSTRVMTALYYAPAEAVLPLVTAPNPEPFRPPDAPILWVTEQLGLPGQPLTSHAHVDDFSGYVLWEEATIHKAWCYLGIHDRAARMHAIYDMEPMGLRGVPEDDGAPPVQIWRLRGRRNPLQVWAGLNLGLR